MRLLDLFCCEGGAALGYTRAGFTVYGVDHVPQPRYPYPFAQADALELLERLLAGELVEFIHPDGQLELLTLDDFAVIHASPPCQAHSTITPDYALERHVDLIDPTRVLLERTGLPWVIENVEGAAQAMRDWVRLCGSSFGLRVRRHRLFESNVFLMGLGCDHKRQGIAVGVYGSHGDASYTYRRNGMQRGRKARNAAEAADVMGIPWASWHGATQAIPPAFAEFIGVQLAEHVRDHAGRGSAGVSGAAVGLEAPSGPEFAQADVPA